MITIICVYNNFEVLNKWFLKSIKNQNVDYQLILIDNSKLKFTSAAKALNHGAKKARGKYIMFVHQDVKLCSTDWLEKAEKILDSLKKFGVAGVAGVSEIYIGKSQMENIIYEHVNPITKWGTYINEPKCVQTLDECLLIIPKKIFNKHKFDEKTCDNWHFYGVDYSLTVQNEGMCVYVIPLKIHHESLGFYQKLLSPRISTFKHLIIYYQGLKQLKKKHGKIYEWIYTTNGTYYTGSNLILQDLKRFFFKRWIKK